MSRPSCRVPDQVSGDQRAWCEQLVVHFPELALPGRGLVALGGEQRVRVHVGERQVPPHVAQVTVVGQQLADHRFGQAAERHSRRRIHERDRAWSGPRT